MIHLIPSIYLNILLTFGFLFLLIEGLLFIFRRASNRWRYFFRLLPYFSPVISLVTFKQYHSALFHSINPVDLEKGSRILSLCAMIRNGLPSVFLKFTIKHEEGFSFTLFDWIADKTPFIWIFFSLILLLFSAVRLAALLGLFYKERRIQKWPLTRYWNPNFSYTLSKRLLRKKVKLYTSSKASSPLFYSYSRPRIILPKGIDHILSTQELESVLLHELAHHSLLDQFLFPFIRLLSEIFFLPIRRLEISREMKCDELAIQGSAKKTDLLSSIKKIAKSSQKNALTHCHLLGASPTISRVRRIPKIKKTSMNLGMNMIFLTLWLYLLLGVCRTQIALF